MKFFVDVPQTDQKFSLIYRDEDFSFDIEPLDGTGISSIMINDLQLEIDDEGTIMYVWGYCPLLYYEATEEFPKKYQVSSLNAILDKPPVLGISYRLNESKRWPIYINKKKGWICIGIPKIENRQAIEFAPSCVAILDNQELVAIWLQPKELPKFLL